MSGAENPICAKLMQERAADAIRKRGQGEIALIGPTTRAFYEAHEIILALPAPTDAEVLVAAMELPQIKALLVALLAADEYIDKGHFQMARNITRAATAALVKI